MVISVYLSSSSSFRFVEMFFFLRFYHILPSIHINFPSLSLSGSSRIDGISIIPSHPIPSQCLEEEEEEEEEKTTQSTRKIGDRRPNQNIIIITNNNNNGHSFHRYSTSTVFRSLRYLPPPLSPHFQAPEGHIEPLVAFSASLLAVALIRMWFVR